MFEARKHARYLKFCLRMLPRDTQSLDTNRLTIAFFALSGLDVLGEIEHLPNRIGLIDWIYSLQVKTCVPEGAKELKDS